jgi:hypothetical protein
MVDKATTDRVAVQAVQYVILAAPIAIERGASDEEGLHPLRANVRQINVLSHASAKGL